MYVPPLIDCISVLPTCVFVCVHGPLGVVYRDTIQVSDVPLRMDLVLLGGTLTGLRMVSGWHGIWHVRPMKIPFELRAGYTITLFSYSCFV